jgi:predicted nucleotide-binding protein
MDDSEIRLRILAKYYEMYKTGEPLKVSIPEWSDSWGVPKRQVGFALKYLVDSGSLKGEYVPGTDIPLVLDITAAGIDAFESHQAVGVLRTKGPELAAKPVAGEIVSAPTSKKIFIVHGKDEENTKILKEMLVQWGFEPIIMIEEPHMGRTLIEKLIALKSDVGYVFVLMTPDDIGIGRTELTKLVQGFESAAGHHPANATELAALLTLKGRARQNVIFEYGLFMGHLGREKVCLLKKGTVDFPTDLLGLGYIEFNEKVSEEACKEQIERELRGAHYQLKSQKVIWDVGPISSFGKGDVGPEVSDDDLPPEILAEIKRLRKSPRTVGGTVRVSRDEHGTYRIQYDEI